MKSEPAVRMCFWSGPLEHWQYLQECALFCFFWGRKQQVQHILCCDKLFHWRQERFQGWKQGCCWRSWTRMSDLISLLLHVGDVYHALYLSALNSNCKERSHHTVFIGFFLLFSIESTFYIILVFSRWEWYQPDVTFVLVGFPPPQNSAIPTLIKKAESRFLYLALVWGFLMAFFFLWFGLFGFFVFF